jgi:hypothetical protein
MRARSMLGLALVGHFERDRDRYRVAGTQQRSLLRREASVLPLARPGQGRLAGLGGSERASLSEARGVMLFRLTGGVASWLKEL